MKDDVGSLMQQGKKTRILVRTSLNTYLGDMLIPPMRNRLSDVFNDESIQFINLTDVTINESEKANFVALNKNMVESVMQVE